MKQTLLLLGIVIGVVALVNLIPSGEKESHGHVHLMENIRKHQDTLTYSVQANPWLDTLALIPVDPIHEDVRAFFTEKRTTEVTSFPCSNCHQTSLEELRAESAASGQKAHWGVHLVHASEKTMQCATCHQVDHPDDLRTLTGEDLAFDRSFELCGQCHSTQLKDWEGGAHGKSLNGWTPPRVAKTCVSCHNPHQPAFPSRFPARYNTHQLNE